MRYHHRFRVRASLARVAGFHSRPASMAAITPPPIITKIQHAPAILADGDEMGFTLWLGPLPMPWLARIEAVSPTGFTDRQLRGPFAEWAHRHTFVTVDEYNTDVIDDITLQLNRHPLWWFIGLGMWFSLPALFAFRAWKTRSLLQ